MKLFSAVVKDKQIKKTVLIENKEYSNKQDFIKDLKCNGYAVNPDKVKESDIFDYIMNYTNCEPQEWKYINRVPNENNTVYDMIQEGLKKESEKHDKQFNKLMEESIRSHKQLLLDINMTEEQWQEWKRDNIRD